MLTDEQKQAVAEKPGGTAISTLVKNLFHAIDGEAIEQKALELTGQPPGTEPGDFAPFDAQGGLGKMFQLFGDCMDALIEEINGELVA